MLAGLVVVAVVAIVAYTIGADRPASDDPGTAQAAPDTDPEPVEVATASDFDPDGEGSGENPGQVPLALDGDPSTAWRTKTYFDGPALAPYRSGVGLLLDLGSETEVREVKATLVGSGYDVALLAAPEGSSAPTTADGLEELASAQDAGGEVTLAADEAVTTRYLVLWLRALPAVPGGFKGGVAEVGVSS